MDVGGKFNKELQSVIKKVGIKLRVVTPYYPEAQGIIERGHKEIKDALVKICGENGAKLKFGQPAVLNIYLDLETYLVIEWDQVTTTSDLLQARTEQLPQKEENIWKAQVKLKESRETSIKYWDRRLAHRIRKPLRSGDLVLVYNRTLESQWGLLFKNRWNGPYRVLEQENNGPYILEG